MPYISRNENGEIVEIHAVPKGDAKTWVELTAPEVVAFLEKNNAASEYVKEELVDSDANMARVVEDLIDLLLEKQVFTFTELPEVVQNKLNARKKLRKDINALEGLIVDDDAIF